MLHKIYRDALTLLSNESNLVPFKSLDKTKIASLAIGASQKNTFQEYLNKYTRVDTYNVSTTTISKELSDRLEQYDLLIVSIHGNRINDTAQLQQLTKAKKTALVLFTQPARLHHFNATSNHAKALLMAYDDTEPAQMGAAQALFGGIALSGRLPVSSGRYREGTGLNTEKVRLGYAHPEETGIASEDLNRIDRIALEGIRMKAYPGCQIFIAKDGEVIYERSFGTLDYRSNSKVTDATIYDLASITKALHTPCRDEAV